MEIAVAAVVGVSKVYQGWKQKQLKEEEAEGYRDAARRRMGAGTREAYEETRRKEFMESRALAVAANQGTATGSVGITRLIGDLNAEGEYRVMSKIWSARDDAAGLRFRAEAAEREGKAALTAGVINGITSGVSTYMGFSKAAPQGENLGARYAEGTLVDPPTTIPSGIPTRSYA